MNNFANKRILVTGASGFIGQYLVQKLCDAGADVHGTSRSVRKSSQKNLTWWEGSFEDFDSAKRILTEVQPDIIFHMAGAVTAAVDKEYILPTYHSLLTSTLNLLTLATELGCERIVLAGSCTEPDELSPIPSSPYAAAKWATNGYGRMFHKVYGAPVVVVRPFMGYGPMQPTYKVIPHVITSLLRGESPELSSGSWVTDWVYIEDMVEGILAAASVAGIEGQTLDLGSGVRISVREIIENITGIIQPKGKPLFGALPDRQHEYTRIADTEYTFSRIGWKAKTAMNDGLERTIEYYSKCY